MELGPRALILRDDTIMRQTSDPACSLRDSIAVPRCERLAPRLGKELRPGLQPATRPHYAIGGKSHAGTSDALQVRQKAQCARSKERLDDFSRFTVSAPMNDPMTVINEQFWD
ncbi:MAG: hypothetical protein Q9168_004210 [Polycauliona sp. 1 TL-2023]